MGNSCRCKRVQIEIMQPKSLNTSAGHWNWENPSQNSVTQYQEASRTMALERASGPAAFPRRSAPRRPPHDAERGYGLPHFYLGWPASAKVIEISLPPQVFRKALKITLRDHEEINGQNKETCEKSEFSLYVKNTLWDSKHPSEWHVALNYCEVKDGEIRMNCCG